MTTKEKIISMLEENKGSYLSGEDIGIQLNISRAAVSKAIKELKNNGYTIDSVNRKGHCIPHKSNTLSLIEIKKNLKYNNDIILKDSVFSTNSEGKNYLVNNPEHGTVIIANEQTNGRGRKGRSFFSPKNTGIYMSIILKPKTLLLENSFKITIATAVAISNAIDEICNKDTQIKWVNDIFLNNKKICGILTEAITDFESGSIENIVLGIGVNFNTLNFPEDLSHTAGSIFLEDITPINRNQLISKIINNLMDIIENLDDSEIIKIYRNKSFLIGRDIIYYEKNSPIQGIVVDIDDNGHLIVQDSNKIIKILKSGEVNFKW